MSDTSLSYAASTNLSIGLTEVSHSGARSSAYVDNSSNKYIDEMVGGRFIAGNSGILSNGLVRVYAYGSTDGVHFSDNADGTDRVHPLSGNAPFLASVAVDGSGKNARFGPFAVAPLFGGILPQYWGVIVENVTGQPLASGSVWHQGIKFTTT